MKLLCNQHRKKLLANGKQTQTCIEADWEVPDHKPVVKLFTPDAGCTWLLSELDPKDPDIAFGLCDLGLGFPELGSVRISELDQIRGKLGLPVERDLYFTPEYPLMVYVRAAERARCITQDPVMLQDAAQDLAEETA